MVSLKGQEGGLVLQDSELEFLFKMFDESLLPAVLVWRWYKHNTHLHEEMSMLPFIVAEPGSV